MPDEPADTETRLDRLERKLDELLAGENPGHATAQAHEERHLDRPSSIEEQVRMELAKAEREQQAAAEKDAEKSERQQIKDNLAKMMEQKPAPPQPRRQRVMWGPR
jgi:hypothetical protein